MSTRKAISKTTRFEVFKRDLFTCQYCGQKAPDVLLVIDHIEPVSKGGTNEILNLITSCQPCNSGKSDRRLADMTVLDKQRKQNEELQERKEQIAMMFKWQKGLLALDDQLITQLADYWLEQIPGYRLNENGIKKLKSLKRKFELNELMIAMKIATEKYIEYVKGEPTKESVEVAWNKVGGICSNRRRDKENPDVQRLYYIRGILKNRLSYIDERIALQLLHKALDANVPLDHLQEHAKSVRNWATWRTEIEDVIKRKNEDHEKGE